MILKKIDLNLEKLHIANMQSNPNFMEHGVYVLYAQYVSRYLDFLDKDVWSSGVLQQSFVLQHVSLRYHTSTG